MVDSPFLIVGGGMAGLAASLGLARIGKSSHLFEKAAAFSEVGAGLQLGPNAVRALQWLGAWDAVAPHCVSPKEIHVRDGMSGAFLQRVPLGAGFEKQFGAPYRVAHRADLQNGLLHYARQNSAITLETNSEVTGVAIEHTTLTFKSGKELAGKAIIAADGVHSTIRKNIGHASNHRPVGHMLYRGIMPTHLIPPGVNTEVVTLWLYPGGHVVHYCVSNWQQFNIVASIEDPAATPATAFPSACKPLADILNMQSQWLAWPGLDSQPDSHWTQNNTVLIGDSAHATLPYLAQGAAMALEDACVLATALQVSDDIPSAFQDFSGQRFERTTAIQNKSRQLGRIYHARNPLRLARNLALKATPPRSFINRLAWIYNWDIKGK